MIALLFAAMAVLSFNDGWEFQRKGESGCTATSVPHDAAFGLPLSRDEDHDHGFAPSPETRYRKTFARPDGFGRFSLKFDGDRKSTRLNSSHPTTSRMPSSA